MADMSWRAPDPTPVRRRKNTIRVAVTLLVVAVVAALVWALAPRVKQQFDASSEGDVFDKAVQAVLDAPAIEVSGRAKMHSAGNAVYFTAVRLDDGTLVADVRPAETGTGLPVVDTGNKVYAHGNPTLWPLMGLTSDFSGWVSAPSAETVSIQSASVTRENVADVVNNPATERDGLTATSPEGVILTVEEGSDALKLTFPLEGGAVSEHTVRPVDAQTVESSQQAVANAVSSVGAQVIRGPGGGFIIEPFSGGRPGGAAPAPAPEPAPEPAQPVQPAQPAPQPGQEPAPEQALDPFTQR